MEEAKLLRELQQLDLDLNRASDKLLSIEAEMGDDATLNEAEMGLKEEQDRVAAQQKEQRDLEWETDDIRTRLKSLKDKLYGGTVKNSKELASLEKEVTHLTAEAERKEDRLLELMSQLEHARQQVGDKEGTTKELRQHISAKKQEILAEKALLEKTVSENREKRESLASTLDGNVLKLYEVLRINKRGRVVASVEQGRCQGCRITLPVSKVQDVRMQRGLVQCDHCERILYIE
ncbi:MAG: C4-type zinc ribbon domain-containing protein [Chloroflexota bacterium]|nr:C4-type zinc ribbon domain-containing protein [Chloroflexota bacterium]